VDLYEPHNAGLAITALLDVILRYCVLRRRRASRRAVTVQCSSNLHPFATHRADVVRANQIAAAKHKTRQFRTNELREGDLSLGRMGRIGRGVQPGLWSYAGRLTADRCNSNR